MGQIFDVIDGSSDWWLARLVRDVEPSRLCKQGWVPGSFLDKYEGKLGVPRVSEEKPASFRRC